MDGHLVIHSSSYSTLNHSREIANNNEQANKILAAMSQKETQWKTEKESEIARLGTHTWTHVNYCNQMIVSRIYLLTHSFIHLLSHSHRQPRCIHFQSSMKIQSQTQTAPAHIRSTHTRKTKLCWWNWICQKGTEYEKLFFRFVRMYEITIKKWTWK